MIKHDKTREHG